MSDYFYNIEKWRTIRAAIWASFLLIIFLIMFFSQRVSYYPMGFNYPMEFYGITIAIFLAIIVIAFITWIFLLIPLSRNNYLYNYLTIRNLQMRYARGEISEKEYKKILKNLNKKG